MKNNYNNEEAIWGLSFLLNNERFAAVDKAFCTRIAERDKKKMGRRKRQRNASRGQAFRTLMMAAMEKGVLLKTATTAVLYRTIGRNLRNVIVGYELFSTERILEVL